MPVQLPEPDADEREHAGRVAALIRDEIAASGGVLDFARYMDLALYAPGLGYYSAGAAKFGAAGDFVTAPELGFVFARCLARCIASILRSVDEAEILELGPGSGVLAAELLLELERLGALPARYRLLEPSADLRARQKALLTLRCPHLEKRIEWLDEPLATAWSGVLVANEVIDALPVRLFAARDDGLRARGVGTDDQTDFVWRETAADAALREAVTEAVGDLSALPDGYCSEVRPMLDPWFSAVTRTLNQGAALFIDYGCSRTDYYAPQRNQGTLRCHYRHRVHNDPLILPGLQDITAWVDFDALIAAASNQGFALGEYASQAQFLLAHGLDEVFAQAYAGAANEAGRYALAQQVKRLTLPGEMGDVFRVMLITRELSE
jgi:SAM-dependent MidA family methyltransferase